MLTTLKLSHCCGNHSTGAFHLLEGAGTLEHQLQMPLPLSFICLLLKFASSPTYDMLYKIKLYHVRSDYKYDELSVLYVDPTVEFDYIRIQEVLLLYCAT